MNKKYFKVDPISYKPSGEEKEEFLKKSSEFLQLLFSKKEEEIYEASKSYVGNSDGLRNFIFIVQSWRRILDYELTKESRVLSIISSLFTIEGLCLGIKPRDNYLKDYKVYYFFKNFISIDEKRTLLNSFTFSKAVTDIPVPRTVDYHIMYEDMLKSFGDLSQHYKKENGCSAEETSEGILCECSSWLSRQSETEVNKYLRILSKKIYEMRSSLVHDGIGPVMCHTENRPPDYSFWGFTVAGIYSKNNDKNQGSPRKKQFIYSTAMSRKKYEEIFNHGLWQAFCAGLPN